MKPSISSSAVLLLRTEAKMASTLLGPRPEDLTLGRVNLVVVELSDEFSRPGRHFRRTAVSRDVFATCRIRWDFRYRD